MKYLFALVLFFSALFFSCKTNLESEKTVAKEVNYIPYYLKVYEADSLYIVKNYQKSYNILDSLFKEYKPLQMTNYLEISNYYKLKIILKKKINLKEFSKLISKYRVADDAIKNDSIFKIYYKKNKYFFDKNFSNLRNMYLGSLKIDLRNDIKEMRLQDQLYRNKDYQVNIDKQNKIDSINANKLIKIFSDYGYPNESIIGDFIIDNSFTDIGGILLHTKDSERIDYFMPKILEFIKKGESPPRAYASLRDQFNLYHGDKQYYGSYENKTDIPVKELNKRRKTIGLSNYGYEKWRFEQLYPNE